MRAALDIHRRSVMQKMAGQKMAGAPFADLVRIAERLEIPVVRSRRMPGP